MQFINENECFICTRYFGISKTKEEFTDEIKDAKTQEKIMEIFDEIAMKKGPQFICKTENCPYKICERCFRKLTEELILSDEVFKCPHCRQPDWKYHYSNILVHLMIKINGTQYIDRMVEDFLQNQS